MDHNIREMEEYAKEHHIPIMLPDGIEFVLKYIEENSIQNILEIGTAIGYSAIRMCLVNPNIKVTTIERDETRYLEAQKNVAKCRLENRIQLILKDALETNINGKYDLIFIDAAKSQYIKFFEKYENNLNENGVIVSDNLNFHGLTHTKEYIASRNVRGIVKKLNHYIEYLKNNDHFTTTFYEIGDGVSISKLINQKK